MVIIFNTNEQLRQSWERSKAYGADQIRIENAILEEHELKQYKEKNETFLNSIYPTIEHLAYWFSSLNSMIFITDKNGYVLKKIADPKFSEDTEAIFLQEGSCCSEEVRGTNSAGIVSVEKKTLPVVGKEHYLESHQKFYCIGSPIFDSYGNLSAILNITGYVGQYQPPMLGIVDALTRKVENFNLLRQNNSQLILSLNPEQQGNCQALLAVDEDGLISSANRQALELLNLDKLAPKQIHIDKVLAGAEQLLKREALTSKSVILRNKDGKETQLLASIFIDSRPKFYTFDNKRPPLISLDKPKTTKQDRIGQYTFNDIYSEDTTFQSAIRMAKRAAKTDYIIMITGESGTGKDMLSQAIHNASSRANKPFVAMNCGGITKSLMESELFGYESGAFTGAKRSGKPGKFEQANGGTLFLDEIAEMPMEMQIALLRVLQDFTVTRISGTKPIKVDVRIIAATHTDLWKKVQEGKFRADLFYRLQGIHIVLPPLRERSDRLSLAELILKTVEKELGEQNLTFSSATKKFIETYSWPGNVRQLIGALREAAFSSENGLIDVNCFPNYILSSLHREQITISPIEQAEKKAIDAALTKTEGNITKAAKLLGIGRTTLYRKLKKLSENEIIH